MISWLADQGDGAAVVLREGTHAVVCARHPVAVGHGVASPAVRDVAEPGR